jgi:hypothetical protein
MSAPDTLIVDLTPAEASALRVLSGVYLREPGQLVADALRQVAADTLRTNTRTMTAQDRAALAAVARPLDPVL